jgi:hypothetical protein
VVVNWGDGSPLEEFTYGAAGTYDEEHTYTDEGTFPITATVTDACGNTAQDTAEVSTTGGADCCEAVPVAELTASVDITGDPSPYTGTITLDAPTWVWSGTLTDAEDPAGTVFLKVYCLGGVWYGEVTKAGTSTVYNPLEFYVPDGTLVYGGGPVIEVTHPCPPPYCEYYDFVDTVGCWGSGRMTYSASPGADPQWSFGSFLLNPPERTGTPGEWEVSGFSGTCIYTITGWDGTATGGMQTAAYVSGTCDTCSPELYVGCQVECPDHCHWYNIDFGSGAVNFTPENNSTHSWSSGNNERIVYMGGDLCEGDWYVEKYYPGGSPDKTRWLSDSVWDGTGSMTFTKDTGSEGPSSITVNCGGIETITTTGGVEGTWTALVENVTVSLWGAGGGGGGGSDPEGPAGGGGGGGYSSKAVTGLTVSSGYAVFVGVGGTTGSGADGAAGGDSYFIDALTVMAKGGAGGQSGPNGGVGGAGGAAASGVGTVKYSGGAGANGSGTSGGGGGEGSGTAANGNAGSGASGGTGGDGGDGGGGGAGASNGTDGTAPGGGGGGGGMGGGGTTSGGLGASGKIIITWVGNP